MTVRVRFFAALRDAVGCDSFELATPQDVVGVIDAIHARFGDVAYTAVTGENVRIALNREFVDRPVCLRDGDEIAFMPPITGG